VPQTEGQESVKGEKILYSPRTTLDMQEGVQRLPKAEFKRFKITVSLM
jgi:hypothetical protein